MTAPTGPSPSEPRHRAKGFGEQINELVALVITYARQETLEPIRNLGRYTAFGVAGAILIAAGGVVLTVTAVRLVQAETGNHLTGNLSWVPYIAGLLVAGLGGWWAASRIGRGLR